MLGLATLFHASMAPMIFFYILYFMLRSIRIQLSFLSTLFLIAVCSSAIALVTPVLSFTYAGSGVNQSILYMMLVIFLGFSMIFLNRRVVKDVFGFMAVGLFLVIVAGYFIDFSFIRYIGNSIILYLLFIVRDRAVSTVPLYLLIYTPFFLLTLYYSIANYS